MEIVQANEGLVSNLLDTELRHLKESILIGLSTILDSGDAWRRLLEELSSNESRVDEKHRTASKLNLTTENVALIEKQIYCDKSPSLALLKHWSITGRRRPTLKTLIHYLNACQLKWAEEYIYKSVLGLNIPLESNVDQLKASSNRLLRGIEQIYRFESLDDFLEKLEYKSKRYDFHEIFHSANGFCDKPFNFGLMTGTKIGEGRFSTVYRCKSKLETETSTDLQVVAAKLLKSECNMSYLSNEINLMSRIDHPYLLNLLGISVGNGDKDDTEASNHYLCLIYPFVENGSLLDCLNYGLCTRNMTFIEAKDRVNLIRKIASGIDYLHTSCSIPLIHRDIKTANIFIDCNIEPKIGDFTLLSELKNAQHSETDIMQSSVIGTSVYMAPETFQGDVSTKSDAFSFGIVLLEILTGLRPCDEDLGEDLFSYVNEKLSDIEDELETVSRDYYDDLKDQKVGEFLRRILDEKAGPWNFNHAMVIFKISLKLTESRKTNRPEISDIVTELDNLT